MGVSVGARVAAAGCAAAGDGRAVTGAR
jgi:hypothetical protein